MSASVYSKELQSILDIVIRMCKEAGLNFNFKKGKGS